MMKTVLAAAAAAAALTVTPFATPAKAQVDMQGRHFDDRDPAAFYGERRRGYDATVGVSPGGVTVGPQDRAPAASLRPKRRATKKIAGRHSSAMARAAASRQPWCVISSRGLDQSEHYRS
jgi:hypothetical protein